MFLNMYSLNLKTFSAAYILEGRGGKNSKGCGGPSLPVWAALFPLKAIIQRFSDFFGLMTFTLLNVVRIPKSSRLFGL